MVQTHGGPASSDKFQFSTAGNFVQVLNGMGYFVFKPNYRGSTGYGDDFLRNMVGNYFDQAHLDVMTGVDHLIGLGLVDGARMAKMGWSAGGHMTNKIITHTERFKAAASGAGAANWVSMYAQSDIRVYRTPWFGGTPWEEDAPVDQYWQDSPLREVWRVSTPTIFLVGEEDARVPMPQSVEMYRGLKHNGVPTHLYVAPRAGHGWTELRHQLFKANVHLDWFERWVRDRDYEWEEAPGDERGVSQDLGRRPRGAVVRRGHQIAHSSLVDDVGWSCPVLPQLVAEPLHYGMHQPGVGGAPIASAPGAAQQGAVRQHSSVVGREHAQQFVLGGGELQRPAVEGHPASVVVDGQRSQLEECGLGATAQCRPDPRRQLRRRKRLDDVIGGPGFESLRDRLVPPVGRDEDDRHIGQIGNLLHQLDAVGPGQHQIEQDQAGFLRADEARQFPGVARCHYGIPLPW